MVTFTRYAYRQDSHNEAPIIHAHPQFEIGFIHEGSCSYMLGGRQIVVESGDMLFLNGLASHGLYGAESGMICSKVIFDEQLAKIFRSSFMPASPLEPLKRVRDARIRLERNARAECEGILSQINRFYESRQTHPTQLHRMLVAFVDLLLFLGTQYGMNETERSLPSTEKERLANELVAYLEQNYADDLRLEKMEAEFFISKYHLSRIFREMTGLSIFEFLCHKRMEQAKLLLQEAADEYAVSQICHRVGYNHPAHFSRMFKKLVGTTPNQYRKMYRANRS